MIFVLFFSVDDVGKISPEMTQMMGQFQGV